MQREILPPAVGFEGKATQCHSPEDTSICVCVCCVYIYRV